MYRLWFANIPGISPAKREAVLTHCASAEVLYGLDEEEIAAIPGLFKRDAERIAASRQTWDLRAEWMRLAERGIGFVTLEDSDYPARLKRIVNRPYGLYYMGNLPKQTRISVAVVGARGRSAYGSQVAGRLAGELARAEVDVISGMAAGIDADAHAGALDHGGRTYAVLGCGVDICYPARNRYLYENIPREGGILSEYPIGTQPLPAFFPQRNRLIAGLADYTVVIEARKKSGSLITADFAAEQGKEVYALPGRITDALSEGCNRLLAQGAGVFLSVEDFLCQLQLDRESKYVPAETEKIFLEKEERLVYSLFDFAPLGIGTLIEKSPLGLAEMLGILERLKEKGVVEEPIPNYYTKKIW